jgi:hypothetical protein
MRPPLANLCTLAALIPSSPEAGSFAAVGLEIAVQPLAQEVARSAAAPTCFFLPEIPPTEGKEHQCGGIPHG